MFFKVSLVFHWILKANDLLSNMGIKNNLINMTHLFIIFGLIGNWYPVNAQLYNIDTVRQFAANSYDTMKSIYDTYSESSTPSTADIMEKMKDIIASIDEWDIEFKERVETTSTWVLGLPSVETIEQDVHNLTEYIGWIDELYGEFREYVDTPDSLNESTAGELSELYTSENKEDDVINTIRDIFSIISPESWGNYKSSLLFSIARNAHQRDVVNDCGANSPQQLLLGLYSAIVITEMRALTMTDFGYLIKGFKGNVSYIGDMEKTKDKFIKRVEKYLLIMRKVLKNTGRQFRLCDPPEGYIRGESFYEFERFLHRIVLNEMIMTEDGVCRDTCDTLPNPTKIYQCDGIGCHSGVPVCQGSLRYCLSLNFAADFCEYPDDAPRRYQWIRDGWGTYHPDDTRTCNLKFHWPRWHRLVFFDCDICRCICAEESVSSPSNHFISLREQLSDVANNMVIIGLQLKIVNKILHIDIQQSPIRDNRTIDVNKVEWKGVEDIQYDREGSIQSQSFKFYKDNGDGNREEMIEDKDVAVLTWDSRRIYLDKLTSPPNHFITGIRFVRDLKPTSKPIYLEIQATPFNSKLGGLDSLNSHWIGPNDTYYAINNEQRIEYVGEGFRNPEKLKNTLIDTKPNTFIDVDWSSWIEDASQTVIPFLDGRKVSSDSPIPLGGIGLYHKKEAGYGGLLTFVLEEIDMTYIIKNPLHGR